MKYNGAHRYSRLFIIGVADRVGSLEVGKDADVVIFSGHPFDYRTVAEVVIINGEIVHQRE